MFHSFVNPLLQFAMAKLRPKLTLNNYIFFHITTSGNLIHLRKTITGYILFGKATAKT